MISKTRQTDNSNVAHTVCAIDVSGSMDSADYRPTRLAAAISASIALVREKVKSRPQDYVGIVAFSDSAEVACPLLEVRKESEQICKLVEKLKIQCSTDFCAGLRRADRLLNSNPLVLCESVITQLVEFFVSTPRKQISTNSVQKHILFLSDGLHCRGGNPISVADRIKQHGVVIDCVGIGARESIDEELLRKIASVGPDGKPQYRFIGDEQALIHEFKRVAALRIC